MSGQPLKPKEDKYYEFKPFRVPKYRVTFQQAGKLADVPGYVWYTPAPIYIWGRYSEVNLGDLVQQFDVQIFWYRFDKPVFTGFAVNDDHGWNHVLWAAREDQWKTIVDTILETVQFDLPNAKLYQYALQNLKVYDPLSVDTERLVTPNTPIVDVKAFAVLSNERQYAFDTRTNNVTVTPNLVTFKPSPVHVKAAIKLFGDKTLTQDKAFEHYKQIMLSEQDSDYERNYKAELRKGKQ
jgi:hypothetical protein